MIFWDPKATGPDEVGADGTGMWRYALGGKRYMPTQWPEKSGKVGLYDQGSSVVILDKLPADTAPPDYPAPSAG